MPKMVTLHIVVTMLVIKSDHMMWGWCSRPCNVKAKEPIPIIRNVGSAMSSVSRVRIVRMACGRYPNIIDILAT